METILALEGIWYTDIYSIWKLSSIAWNHVKSRNIEGLWSFCYTIVWEPPNHNKFWNIWWKAVIFHWRCCLRWHCLITWIEAFGETAHACRIMYQPCDMKLIFLSCDGIFHVIYCAYMFWIKTAQASYNHLPVQQIILIPIRMGSSQSIDFRYLIQAWDYKFCSILDFVITMYW